MAKLFPVQIKGQPNGFILVEEGATAGGGPGAFSGAYADLTGKPVLGTAASTNSTAYATATQGIKADNAQVGVLFKDEATNLGTTGTANVLNFVGAGVTATRASDVITVTVPGAAPSFTWNTITNANVATPVTQNGYIMETGGTLRTVTLPLNVPAGYIITVNASGGQVRIVSNGNTIDRVGAGNDLLLEDNSTATLVAKATGSLEILSAGNVSVAGGGSSGIIRVISLVSVPTTAGASPSTDYVYLVSGTTTLTMPTAVGNTNRYTISNVGVGVVSIATAAAQTIHGTAAPITVAADNSLDLISDGSNWRII